MTRRRNLPRITRKTNGAPFLLLSISAAFSNGCSHMQPQAEPANATPAPPPSTSAAADAISAPQPPAPEPALAVNATAASNARRPLPTATANSTSGASNGARTAKVTEGNDDSIIAARLRRAAEQETNPELKSKLWKEYFAYKRNLQ